MTARFLIFQLAPTNEEEEDRPIRVAVNVEHIVSVEPTDDPECTCLFLMTDINDPSYVVASPFASVVSQLIPGLDLW